VSPSHDANLRRIVQGDFSPQFRLSLALKDVHQALEAVDNGQFTALAGLADEWGAPCHEGWGTRT